jgi:hypothetical protein
VRFSTLAKALEWKKAGGIVLAEGRIPIFSDREGRDDKLLQDISSRVFHEGALCGAEEILRSLCLVIDQDFDANQAGIVVNHRRTQTFDVYFVHNATAQVYDAVATFRSCGTPFQWNVWTGKIIPLDEATQSETITRIPLILESGEAQFIVFDRTKAMLQKTEVKAKMMMDVLPLAPEWEFTLQPTLDNQWGDFRLPASSDILGAEIRRFQFREEFESPVAWWKQPGMDEDWDAATFSYGIHSWHLGPIPADVKIESLAEALSSLQFDPCESVSWQGKSYSWKPLIFSTKWGIEDDPFLRDWQSGPHGLKGVRVEDSIDLHSEIPGVHWIIATVLRMEDVGCVVLSSGSRASYEVWLCGQKVVDKTSEQTPGRHHRWQLPHYHSDRHEILLELKAGLHPLVILAMQPAGQRTRLHLSARFRDGEEVGVKSGSEKRKKTAFFESYPSCFPKATWFRFLAPPGVLHLKVVSLGDLEVWCSGEEAVVCSRGKREDGAQTFEVTLRAATKQGEEIYLRIQHVPGMYRGVLIPEPIILGCVTSKITLGDWHTQGLSCYSGGAWYRQNVMLTEEQAIKADYLNLGQLSATVEIWINGKCAGTLLSPPWKIRVAGLWKSGENRLEILVFSSLAGFYREWIPTPYRDISKQSGLIGPVRLLLK